MRGKVFHQSLSAAGGLFGRASERWNERSLLARTERAR